MAFTYPFLFPQLHVTRCVGTAVPSCRRSNFCAAFPQLDVTRRVEEVIHRAIVNDAWFQVAIVNDALFQVAVHVHIWSDHRLAI